MMLSQRMNPRNPNDLPEMVVVSPFPRWNHKGETTGPSSSLLFAEGFFLYVDLFYTQTSRRDNCWWTRSGGKSWSTSCEYSQRSSWTGKYDFLGVYIYIYTWLVVSNIFYFPSYMGPKWLIFFKMVKTTNQIYIYIHNIYIYIYTLYIYTHNIYIYINSIYVYIYIHKFEAPRHSLVCNPLQILLRLQSVESLS